MLLHLSGNVLVVLVSRYTIIQSENLGHRCHWYWMVSFIWTTERHDLCMCVLSFKMSANTNNEHDTPCYFLSSISGILIELSQTTYALQTATCWGWCYWFVWQGQNISIWQLHHRTTTHEHINLNYICYFIVKKISVK